MENVTQYLAVENGPGYSRDRGRWKHLIKISSSLNTNRKREKERRKKNCLYQGLQSWRVGGRDPPDFRHGVVGGPQGGRELLLYLIMYRKYVRKW